MPVIPVTPIASTFQATPILVAIAWTVFGVLNFWIWRRSRSAGHLVMLISSGWLVLDALLAALGVSLLGGESGVWATAIGVALLTGGFYFTVQPLIAADVAKLFGRHSAPAAGVPPMPRTSFPSVPPRA
jgi:hypothetical protein